MRTSFSHNKWLISSDYYSKKAKCWRNGGNMIYLVSMPARSWPWLVAVLAVCWSEMGCIPSRLRPFFWGARCDVFALRIVGQLLSAKRQLFIKKKRKKRTKPRKARQLKCCFMADFYDLCWKVLIITAECSFLRLQ